MAETTGPAERPEGAEAGYTLRRGEPSASYGYAAADGTYREIAADDAGVVTPETPEDEAILNAFGLDQVREVRTPSGGTTTRKIADPEPVVPAPITTEGPADDQAATEGAAQEGD
ncbi:MAG TPA: hypothetical protein VM305_08405 [Candidatus Limnocylindrales bacterium]|nr:hypothetical protein [Candidatus Limnocylindrales bacterium]